MSVRVVQGRGTKTGEAERIALEARKGVLGAEIGRSTGLFYVPEVLRCEPEQGILEMEWIAGLESLLTVALRHDPRMTELCGRAGAALAAIHAQLTLPEQSRVVLPEPAPGSAEEGVFVHGDFNGDNVCYDRQHDRLVVLDWSSAPLFGGKPTFGSRYFDVTWFGHFFFCSRPARWLGFWQDLGWYQALIQGYAAESHSRFSEERFRAYGRAASPIFAAARRQMLGSAHGLRRLWRVFDLWRAGVRWRRCSLGA